MKLAQEYVKRLIYWKSEPNVSYVMYPGVLFRDAEDIHLTQVGMGRGFRLTQT